MAPLTTQPHAYHPRIHCPRATTAVGVLDFQVPLGSWSSARYNGPITIRGGKSGVPRTTPVAIIELSGRRWIGCPWGDVQCVRSLRAAGRATITVRGRKEQGRATELDQAEQVGFFRDIPGPLARDLPLGLQFFLIVDGIDLNNPVEAAERRHVFELQPLR
jgi:hypothetical protein